MPRIQQIQMAPKNPAKAVEEASQPKRDLSLLRSHTSAKGSLTSTVYFIKKICMYSGLLSLAFCLFDNASAINNLHLLFIL